MNTKAIANIINYYPCVGIGCGVAVFIDGMDEL